ncbi:ImmA/IrrE family metallo-endopeptidase [Photobacterium phosphoreum]|uniref:ImmA/IrrE family metallo-endopeptidase n=1 Tax=Photobacterium phosphoreum TaxID=659 RepID=UPI0007F89FD2|nr:ImmA/IrrE family metallo-endopeptidase [Photobacterium phosphoreum]OBU36739.1 hypothetical protein AYY24_13725 [Photobacterium phosphoreum]PSW33830.1 ImmA/IrrE family metallo-endopeptidase [Photobacterium phosphoreum]
MTNLANVCITLAKLNEINSANELLEALYGDVGNVELPVDIDAIANSIQNIKVLNDIDFQHLDKAGLIKVHRYNNNDIKHIDIWVNPFEPQVRQRFTKAHELGHLIYDISPELNNPNLDEEFIDVLHRKEGVKSFRETRANRFSAQLLMPALLVRKEILKLIGEVKDKGDDEKITKEDVISILSGRFNTSQDAMKFRLQDLNIL